jgi:peptide/nickel transport system permease protein
MELVLGRLPATIVLTAVAMLVALVIALPAGVLAALRPGSALDRVVSSLTLVGYAVPPFWLGLILIIVFAVGLRLLPPSGGGSWQQLILPAIALGLPLAALLARLTRRGLIDAMQRDFIRTARAKGLAESQVLRRHALRHAAIPVITIIGLQIGALLGGAIVTETIFSYPGVGLLLVQGINQRDFPIVQAFVIISAITILIVNLIVDITYRQVDPRIGRSER